MDRSHDEKDSLEPRHDQLSALDRLHALLLTAPEVETFLQEVAGLASRLVSPAASVGITVQYDGDLLTVATSDERAALMDMEQYTVGDGPCLEALRTGEIVEVTDQLTDTRWNGYAPRAREQGVRSTLSLPLRVDGRSMGALNLYSTDRAHAFNHEIREQAAAFAGRASVALTLTIRHAEQASTSQQLEEALASRSIIDQAIGMLMAEQRCDAHTAFDLLRRHSQNHNRKLREVAEDLVTRVSGQPSKPPPPFEPGQKEPFGPV